MRVILLCMKQNLLIGILILAVLIVGGIIFFDSSKDTRYDSAPSETSQTPQSPPVQGEVKIEDITLGEGEEVKSGDTVVVQYRGTLTDGTQFDSSYERNEPFTTRIGVGDVIQGWDQGIPGMKVGGKRKLTIPPQLGYGEQVNGAIPANSTLLFEVELLEIK